MEPPPAEEREVVDRAWHLRSMEEEGAEGGCIPSCFQRTRRTQGSAGRRYDALGSTGRNCGRSLELPCSMDCE